MTSSMVASRKNFLYNGVNRYKGEIFLLLGMRNDDKLVKHDYCAPFDGEESELVTDDSGRRFIDESARVAYRQTAPKDETTIVTTKRVGRPRGTKDSRPRVKPAVVPARIAAAAGTAANVEE